MKLYCLECKKELIKWQKKYCSILCKNEASTKKRFCLNCNKRLNYRQKKFCSSKCTGEFKYKGTIRKWKSGEYSGIIKGGSTNQSIKRYLIETRGEKCEICGWNETHPITNKVPIQLSHIDGNWQNNEESNLELTCPNCHSLTDTFCALNKGNGRPRYKSSGDVSGLT